MVKLEKTKVMSEEKNKDRADWQKNSGRPSNFHEKDGNLKKDGDGNLEVKKDKRGVTSEEDKAIQDTLNSISTDEEEEK